MSQLTEHELYSIEDKIKEGYKDIQIATYIKRDKSIISRLFQKYQRNTFSASFVISDRFKIKSSNTQQHSRIEPWGDLEKYILSKIKKRFSPEQIAGLWHKNTGEYLSKDTIYDWIYIHHSDLVKKYFRRKWKKYRNRKKEQLLNPDKYQIQDRRMIDERPKIAQERKRIGDWEWDTVIWKDRSGAILTMVDRKSGYLKILPTQEMKACTGSDRYSVIFLEAPSTE